MSKAYLLGALHDATERRYTFRISQRDRAYVEVIKQLVNNLGSNAWIYREGKKRNLYIAEFSKSLLRAVPVASETEKRDYIRGYFDTDGGISRSPAVRYYIYFAQKNRADLEQVRKYLVELGIRCGQIHNPSRTVDPNYWRFFVRRDSYERFATIIGSWHPEKKRFLRMVI